MCKKYNPIKVEIKTLKNISGIYQIRNIINNCIYIGSSKDLFTRHSFHFRHLRNGKHQNPYLQNAWNKYGEENFVFEIIEYCNPKERFNEEQYWIDKFYGRDCYNINKDATNPPNQTGRKRIFSEEHKRNISKSQKKRCQNPEVIKQMSLSRTGKRLGKDHINSKPVVCLETGKEYAGMSEAARNIGCSHTLISACCLGTLLTYKGMHWMLKDEYDKLSQNQIQEIIFINNRSKQVVCLETNKFYDKLINAQADMNIDRTAIRKCCDGLQNEAGGYHFVWYETYKVLTEKDIKELLMKHNIDRKQKCKCLETNQIFKSINEASKILNITARQITASCKGQKAYTHGYTFEFV